MSWLEQIETEMIITTGDGKQWQPKYFNTQRVKEYNYTEFNFIGVSGSLIKRNKPKGRRYSINIVFDGDEHLDVAAAFDQSADDPRPWVISHPLHGRMTMQPTTLRYDPSGLSVSRFTGEVIETITTDGVVVSVDPQQQTLKDVATTNTLAAESGVNRIPGGQIEAADQNLLLSNMDDLNDASSTVKMTNDEFNEYFNLFTTVNSAVIDYTQEPLIAFAAIRDFINYPSLLATSVQARLDLLVTQFTEISSGIQNLLTPNEKVIYENNAGNIITAIVQTVISPKDADDYGNAVDVLAVSETLDDTFTAYLTNLDSLQTDNGGTPESYVPDFEVLQAITNVVNYALSNLFQIALNARQERFHILEADSNALILCHRFYGLDKADENLDEFIRNNNIGLNEILQLEKGREIVYYV